ncbi:hypothetical protein M2R47_06310 [Moraxella sp. Tifton1]|uniref:Uncharacterized protein n=1 Tax=Moraxella oculi TaxID=2940516 RepID=A0ABW8U8C4_9GAMM|nr:hypothetical protein [Moraxella sp. Tifton1]MCL1623852.1 hypothetical protein [Moraxella sp. Tifton1]
MTKNSIFLTIKVFMAILWTAMLAWICMMQYSNHLDLKIIQLTIDTNEVKRQIADKDARRQAELKEEQQKKTKENS